MRIASKSRNAAFSKALRRNARRQAYAKGQAYAYLKTHVQNEIIHTFPCLTKAVDIRSRNSALLMRLRDFQLTVGLISKINGNRFLQIALHAIEGTSLLTGGTPTSVHFGTYDDIEMMYSDLGKEIGMAVSFGSHQARAVNGWLRIMFGNPLDEDTIVILKRLAIHSR